MTNPTIRAIHVYPLKSGAPNDLDAAEVQPRGIEHDRRWMLVGADGETITAREFPRLVLVRTAADARGVTFSAPGAPDLRVPHTARGARRRVTVFDNPCAGLTHPPGVDDWFSRYLGTSCRLVHMSEECVRDVLPETGGRWGDEVSFADECPLLLISEGSLRDLNTRLANPVSMRRFRPNLVVSDTGTAFAEDGWRKVRIGAVEFDFAQVCKRCVLTTIDPETAVLHERQEPLRTLSTYRRRGAGGPAFGVHLIPRTTGTVRRGDAIQIIAS